MKTKYFYHNGIKYRITARWTVTNSNYNTMVHVFEIGGFMPITGWAIKETDRIEDQIEGARDNIDHYLSLDDKPLAGTQRSPFGIGS